MAIFLPGNQAEDRKSHWLGGPDFAVEILSRYDRSRKKFGFYKSVGVRDLLLVDRHPWAIELYRADLTDWVLVGCADLQNARDSIASDLLGLTFQLIPGDPRPEIEITRKETGGKWLV